MATQPLLDIGNVFLEPSPTFARLKEKTHAWLPLLLSILLSMAIMYWWVSTVDFPWLIEHMLSGQPNAKPEVREAMAVKRSARRSASASGSAFRSGPACRAC